MSDFAAIQALLEKHAPPQRPQLSPAQDIRRAVTRAAFHTPARNKKHPAYVIQNLKREYDQQPNVYATGAIFGVTGSHVSKLLRANGIKTGRRKVQPTITHGGVVYHFDGKRYYVSHLTKPVQFLHKVVWIKRHGVIAPGMRLIFTGDSRTDFSDNNLRAVSEREYRQHVIGARWRKWRKAA